MILIGRYHSPFTRRVAIAMKLYGLAYEHRSLSPWAASEDVARATPLIRVPALIWDDGALLVDSAAILQALDAHVGPARALLPKASKDYRHALHVSALACGFTDKAIAAIYERNFHTEPNPELLARCQSQVVGALDALESDRAARTAPFWFGDALTHADIAATCMLTFVRAQNPFQIDFSAWPELEAHRARCEDTPEFRDTFPVY